VRAVSKGRAVDPNGVRRYLEGKFGDRLPAVRRAMQRLARTFTPKELGKEAYRLYEAFRPEIPAGKKGWGAKGELDLGLIRHLSRRPAAPTRRG